MLKDFCKTKGNFFFNFAAGETEAQLGRETSQRLLNTKVHLRLRTKGGKLPGGSTLEYFGVHLLALGSSLGDGHCRDRTPGALSDLVGLLGGPWVLLGIARAGQDVGRRRRRRTLCTSK